MIQDVRAYTTALSLSYAGRAGCAPTALSTCRVGSSSSGGSVTISLTPFPTHADLEGELQRSAAASVQEAEGEASSTHNTPSTGELMAWFKSGAFPTSSSTGSGEILLLVAPPPQIPRTSSSPSTSGGVGPSLPSLPFIGASVFGMSDISTSSKIVRYEGNRWVVVEGGGGSSAAPLRPWAEQIMMLTESIGAGRCSLRPTSSTPSGWEVVVESDSLVPGDVVRLRWYLPVRLTSTSNTTATATTTSSRLKFIQQTICSITLTLYPTVAVHNAKTNAELVRLQAANAALVRELDEARRDTATNTWGGGANPTVDGAARHQAGRNMDEVSTGNNTNAGRGATGRDRHGGPQVVTSVSSQRGGKRSRGVKID